MAVILAAIFMMAAKMRKISKCYNFKSIGQQIKILERLQHISDGLTDGRPAFLYPPLRFEGKGTIICCGMLSNPQSINQSSHYGGHFGSYFQYGHQNT
jgi:hypothetical protein